MLSALLSFVNGGYLGPFYIQGMVFQKEENLSPISNVNAFVLNYKTSPLEQLHDTWLTFDSNLALYIQCFPTLKRMLGEPAWVQAFGHVQSHYFQTLTGISWATQLSALGSALERLAYAILVLDQEDEELKHKHALLFDPKQRSQARKAWKLGSENPSVKRLHLLLERIGLTKERGHDIAGDVQRFVYLRNDAVHIDLTGSSQDEVFKSFKQTLQWLEEILLWRLGYTGKYADRSSDFSASTEPRYDTNLHNRSWDVAR